MTTKHNMLEKIEKKMSIITAIHDYVSSVLNRVPGMKILLVDAETVGIVSMVMSQSQILEQEVFLVEVVDKVVSGDVDANQVNSMKHLKAVSILRPTTANFLFLTKELSTPRFSEYHLFFTNLVPQNRLEQLAGCDVLELVHQVQEVYADVYAVNSDLFSLNLPSTVCLTTQQSLWTSYEEAILSRIVDGIFASAISLRMHPFVRYTRTSALCLKVATLLQAKIDDEHILFEQLLLPPSATSIILLLDRRDDPVTPLLNQWTYQAMCHELVGLDKNRMDLKSSPPTSLVMSPGQDSFYEENLISNFGDLAVNIEKYLKKFQEQTKSNSTSKLDSIEAMQSFIDSFPEFKKLGGNVSKHVSVVHELSRLVSANNLITLSALEQEIACEDTNRADQFKRVGFAIGDPTNSQLEKLRLVLLYSIRYPSDQSGIAQLAESLQRLGIDNSQIQLINLLGEYANPTVPLNGSKNVFSLIRKAAGFSGIENVYTQHKSELNAIVESFVKGRIKDTNFPYVESKRREINIEAKSPKNAIVFVVGGTTYEEARDVKILNTQYSNTNIVLGGTTIHNSKTFLADVAQLLRIKREAGLNNTGNQ